MTPPPTPRRFLADGAWLLRGEREPLLAEGYVPSLYGPEGWWVSPAVELVSRRLRKLPVAGDQTAFAPDVVSEPNAPLGMLGHEPGVVFAMGRHSVRAKSRWDACVALLAHHRPDDVELVALASVLIATGRVEPL